MSRRSRAGGKPAKSQRRKTAMLKHRNARKTTRQRGASIAGQETVVARLTYERDEALLRETANAEILSLISKSPGDLELVFRTILENATRICNANFGNLFRFDGENLYPVAQFKVTPVRVNRVAPCARTFWGAAETRSIINAVIVMVAFIARPP